MPNPGVFAPWQMIISGKGGENPTSFAKRKNPSFFPFLYLFIYLFKFGTLVKGSFTNFNSGSVLTKITIPFLYHAASFSIILNRGIGPNTIVRCWGSISSIWLMMYVLFPI